MVEVNVNRKGLRTTEGLELRNPKGQCPPAKQRRQGTGVFTRHWGSSLSKGQQEEKEPGLGSLRCRKVDPTDSLKVCRK